MVSILEKKKAEKIRRAKLLLSKGCQRVACANKSGGIHANRVKNLEDNLFPAIGKAKYPELNTEIFLPIKAVELSGRLEVASRLQQRTTASCVMQCKWVD
jgi:hypothetical protein